MIAAGVVGRVDPRARRERLRAVAVRQGLDAVLVNLLGVRQRVLLLRADGADVLGTDGRYTTQAGTQAPDVELIDRGTVSAVARQAVRRGAGWLGFESHEVTVDGYAGLEKVLADEASGPAPELVSIERAVEDLRAVKDEGEIEAAARVRGGRPGAGRAAEGALRPGRTELQVGRELDARMLALGAEAVSFETIVATGANSAIPHHRPDATVLRAGDFLKLDFGATVDGYHPT